MIDLSYLQRQRKRLYKNDLKRQFEQKQQMKKNQSMQIKYRQKQIIANKVIIMNNQVKQQKIKQFQIKNQIKQQNEKLVMIKSQVNQLQQSRLNEIPLKGNSMIDKLYNQQYCRSQKSRQINKKLNQLNLQQQNAHKYYQKQIKSNNMTQQIKHMQRLREIQQLRKQQNEAIKQKHSKNDPHMFQMHKNLQQINQQYKKSLQSFAYNGKDILDSLKRDDSKILYQKRKSMNNQLIQQMQQKKYKHQIQKNISIQKQDLKNSILSNILFKDQSTDKKSYAQYLKRQIQLTKMKKSQQKGQKKQKHQINSIFGGQLGPQRLKMMKYIDKNLGIQSEVLKKVQPTDRMNSSFRIKNLYQNNGQPISNNIQMDKSYTFINQKKLNPQQNNTNIRKIQQNNRNNSQNIKNQLAQANRSNSSRLSHGPTKSYLSYDFIQGSPRRYQF